LEIDQSHKKLVGSAGSVSVGIFISRITGFLREIALAALFGTGASADIFAGAFRIPNLFRQLLGEGVFNAAFIPKYTQVLHKKGEDKAKEFASTVGIILILIAGIISLAGVILTRQLVPVLFFGWKVLPDKLELTIKVTRILFPYLFLVIVYSFFSGFLNARKIFFLPSVASAFMNIVGLLGILSGLFIFSHWGQTKLLYLVSFALLAGGVVQGLITVFPSFKAGFVFLKNLKADKEDLREFIMLLLPGMMSFAVAEVNHLVDLFLASLLPEGSVSALRYANLLVLLPLSLFGTSVYIALLPSSSELAASGSPESITRLTAFGTNLVFAILLPISALMIAFRTPLTKILFQRGAFSGTVSTPMTAMALSFYAYGLFAYGGVKGIIQAFFSLRDTKTPFKISVYCMLLNIILNLILMGPLKHGGLALATSISSIVNLLVLLVLLKQRLKSFPLVAMAKKFVVLTILSVFVAYIAFLVFVLLRSVFDCDSPLCEFAFLGIAFTLAGTIFIFAGNILKIEEISIIGWGFKRLFGKMIKSTRG